MARAYSLPIVGVALALAGCGGEDRGRPSAQGSSGAALDPCQAADGYEFRNLINFEPTVVMGRESTIAQCDPSLMLRAGNQCDFYFNYDHAHTVVTPDLLELTSVAAAQDCVTAVVPDFVASKPVLFSGSFQGEPLPEQRCGMDSSAFHLTASNIAMCYGSNGRLGWGAGVDITFGSALDASEWDGVSFWIRRGSSVGGSALILSVVDPYTGGPPYCVSMDPAPGEPPTPDTEKCDAFGTAVTMREEWTFVPALFSAMRQKGFGAASPSLTVDPTSISRMQILIGPGNWDIWIDDLALFRRPG